MSQENLEIVRRGDEAFRRADWDAVDANMDHDILIRTDARWPEQRIYGRRAALAFYRGLWESLGPDVRLEEIVDLGDRVLVRWRYVIRGEQSGVQGEECGSTLETFRDGRIILAEYFLDHAEALKAVGLEE